MHASERGCGCAWVCACVCVCEFECVCMWCVCEMRLEPRGRPSIRSHYTILFPYNMCNLCECKWNAFTQTDQSHPLHTGADGFMVSRITCTVCIDIYAGRHVLFPSPVCISCLLVARTHHSCGPPSPLLSPHNIHLYLLEHAEVANVRYTQRAITYNINLKWLRVHGTFVPPSISYLHYIIEWQWATPNVCVCWCEFT